MMTLGSTEPMSQWRPYRATRWKPIRGFSPAVVLYAPTSRALLLEAFNLGNKQQRARVQKHTQRELYAATVANALIADLRGEGKVVLPPQTRDNTKPSWKKKKKSRKKSKKKRRNRKKKR